MEEVEGGVKSRTGVEEDKKRGREEESEELG